MLLRLTYNTKGERTENFEQLKFCVGIRHGDLVTKNIYCNTKLKHVLR